MDCKVKLAQIQPKLGDIRYNFDMICGIIKSAVEDGIDLIVFPELALTGYFLKDLVPDVALTIDSVEIDELKKLSKNISIAIGFVEESREHLFYNSAIYLEHGEIIHCHRKVYLPTYGLFDEQRYLACGDKFRSFETKFGRIGMLICEDAWHLSASYILAMDGAKAIITLSSSPGRGVEGEELGSAVAWQKLASTTAMFLSCYFLYCNRVGYEDGINFWGGSEILLPSGNSAARGKILEEDFVVCRLKSGNLRRERIFAPLLRDENLSMTIKELERIEMLKRG